MWPKLFLTPNTEGEMEFCAVAEAQRQLIEVTDCGRILHL